MRDAGLTHLLSISGLHVSAVIAAAYLLAIRLLALWPWLALRVRLPIVAAGCAALAGIAYTLLTGAEVPTIRSCVGAVLVLMALALGREPLSLRMIAVAAILVHAALARSADRAEFPDELCRRDRDCRTALQAGRSAISWPRAKKAGWSGPRGGG